MTIRHAAGGAGHMDEPERGRDEQQVEDPAGRPEPYVKGPTGAAPLASESRGDPGADGDRRGEGGVAAGVIAGTSVAGPIGGVAGAIAGGGLGSLQDEGHERHEDEARDHESRDTSEQGNAGAYTPFDDRG